MEPVPVTGRSDRSSKIRTGSMSGMGTLAQAPSPGRAATDPSYE
jgi:hypothetical protein